MTTIVYARIDKTYIDSDLTNFPVGIRLTSSDSILSGLGSTDYEGFHFTANGVECYAEVDIWDMTGEEAIIWVNVPNVYSDNDTIIKIENIGDDNTAYVGITGSTPAQNVWDSNFVAVYHMSQDPIGGIGAVLDSTSNGNDANGINFNGVNDWIDGDFGKAINFGGTNEYVTIPTDATLDAIENMTIESFINFDEIPVSGFGDAPIFSLYYSTTDRVQIKATESNEIRVFNDIDNVGSGLTTSSNVVTIETPYHIVTKISSANWFTYVDASEVLELTATQDIADLNDGYVIHLGYLPVPNYYLNGNMSFVAISNILRSDAWIKATYHVLNQDLITILEPTNDYLEVTIDSSLIDSDLTNFPVGIKIDSSDSILSGLGATDYEGFHFFSNGVECYAEIDIWDMISEKATIWVNVPTVLSASDTVIKIENIGDDNTSYVGITGSTPAQNVWDSNFVLVYHLSQDPSGGANCILDSTSNISNGTPNGGMTSGDLVDGDMGKALDFDGSNDYISMSDPFSVDPSEVTAELLGKNKNTSSEYRWLGFNNDGCYFAFQSNKNGTPNLMRIAAQDGTSREIDSSAYDFTSEYRYVSLTIKENDFLKGYIDLDYLGSVAINNFITISATGRILAASRNGGSHWSNAYFDEFRLSDIVRSADWLKATAANLKGLLTSNEYVAPVIPSGGIYGQISINGKNVNIIGVFLIEKGQWRTVEEIYMLNDYAWRQNIKS